MSKWVVNIDVPYEGSYDIHVETAEAALSFAKNTSGEDGVYIREAVQEYEIEEFEKLVASGEIT